MAQDYPLEELSPRAFEQLTVALVLKVLGNGVEAFGSGPDGGREATYRGQVNWSATAGFGAESWDGYVVIQAKQKETLGTPAQNAAWLRKEISDEFDAWMSDDSRRGQLPQYVVFVTNARLSSVSGTGGIDQINSFISQRIADSRIGSDGKPDSLRARGMRAGKVWHRDQLNGLLTAFDGVRTAFKGLLTVGDILARLNSLNGLLTPDEFEPVLKAHALNTIGTERWVNFREAGGTSRQSVEQVFIDLKAEGTEDSDASLLKEVILHAESVIKPSFAHDARHLVITGQPGSGKSTITLFLTQMYRVAFLSDELLTPTAADVRDGTADALRRVQVESPRNHRWPIRVNLAEYADAIGPSGDKSLLRWLSERVAARAEIEIKPHTLRRWMVNWPSLVILDGLDEVTAPEVRPRVLDEIRAFVEDADQGDADLLVIITTRPTSDDEQIMPERFRQLSLRYLDADTALSYGRHVTTRRLADDLDRRDQVISRFERHAADATMLRLMKTPLQVLIMTLILERFGVLPADRYQLFWRYFETIYERESAKTTTLAPLLAEQRRAITELHETVGLALQVHAETATDSRAIMSKPELRGLAMQRLVEVGYQPGEGIERIADRIVQAATERLVLLVPAEDDGVSFEIRSLQEVMAARALSSGTDEQVRVRMMAIASSPHWRNTFVFIAGRLFAEGPDHRRDLVAEVVERVDQREGWPGWLCSVGPEVAAFLLDDGLAATTPRWQRRLIDVALRCLTGTVPIDDRALAVGLSAAGSASKNDLMYIRNALKTALAGTPAARHVAQSLIRQAAFGGAIPDTHAAKQPVAPGEPLLVADLIAPHSGELGVSAEVQGVLDGILEELRANALTDASARNLQSRSALASISLPLTLQGLLNTEVGLALELMFGALPPERWAAAPAVSYAVASELTRAPVGGLL